MIPAVTVLYGSLDDAAKARLPGWTLPFLVATGTDMQRQAAEQGVTLELVSEEGVVTLTDSAPDAFAREFGTLDAPPQPVLTALGGA